MEGMTPTAWIALASLGFLVMSTVATSVVGGVIWISRKFDAHEQRDQERHEDNLGKFSTVASELGGIKITLAEIKRSSNGSGAGYSRF